MPQKIVLASTSPRRRMLMKKIGLPFLTVDSGYVEKMDIHQKPQTLVTILALGKAQKAAKKHPNDIIVAGDTVVVFEKMILGKPKNKRQAAKVLNSLNGKQNQIVTSLVVLNGRTKKVITKTVIVKVWLKKLSQTQIINYVNTGEPFDRAGSYSVDGKYGRDLIKKIDGDFDAAMGLPIKELAKILKSIKS